MNTHLHDMQTFTVMRTRCAVLKVSYVQLKLLFTITACDAETTCFLWRKFPARMTLYKKFLWWATIPSQRDQWLLDFAHAQSYLHLHVPGVWDHSRVHMYLVVGLCKLGTTFCVNFEQQRSVYALKTSSASILRKSVDFAWTCLSDPPFTNHLPFKISFGAPRMIVKSSFYCMSVFMWTFVGICASAGADLRGKSTAPMRRLYKLKSCIISR